MSRAMKITVAVLLLGVAFGMMYLRGLHERVLRLARLERTEEQKHREVTQPVIATPTDTRVKAKLFWASADKPGALEPVEVELPLSADPVQRSKQLINVLIAGPVNPEQRTVPAEALLIEFYLLPDGTAIADFSDTLTTSTPSGILTEQMAVDSLARTLEAGVDSIRRLKILIHGQESETLAGHVDLTGFIPLQRPAAPPTPEKVAPGKLTASDAPGKLSR